MARPPKIRKSGRLTAAEKKRRAGKQIQHAKPKPHQRRKRGRDQAQGRVPEAVAGDRAMSADPRRVASPSGTGGGQIVPMLPTWPEVRCDRCRRVYTMPEDRRTGLVSGNCPQCHYVVFSTTIVGDVPAVTFDFDTFGREAPRG